ncbi:MAG: ABC transporter permease [Anaerolineae bacterium]|jgi:sodium transport system permease protein
MLKAMRTVFGREALDLLRDRRALFFLFAVPLVAPILGAGAGLFILWQVARQAGEGIPIVVVNGEQLPGLVDRLEETRMLELVDLPSDPEKALQSGELLAVLEVPPNAAEALAAEEQVSLRLTSSRSGWLPDFAVLAIEGALAGYGDEVLAERLDGRELDRSWLEPVRLDREVAAPTGVAAAPISGEAGPSSFGSIFLPLAVASWAFSGGLNLVAAMTVGEKEHRTMESLLVTPASRIGIVLGKIALSILVSAVTVGLWSLDSLGYTFLLSTVPAGLGGLVTSFTGQLGNLGLAIVWLLLLMLPFMTMTNGLVAAVCTFAKNYRESNLFLGFFQLLLPGATLLAIFGIGASPPVAVYALPVAGVLVAMRDLFGGGVAPGALALAWAAAALYAVGAILLAAYVFSREWALMRGV